MKPDRAGDMTKTGEAIKRAIDIAGSAAALGLLAPLLAALALAVRLDSPGPSLFRQRRLGRGGRPFTALKFRTMVENAPDVRNADGSALCREGDPRVTRLGRLLRQWSLDELPQLFNVLAGQMSLLGPRPDQVDQIRYYTPAELRRLDVKPGLTGLAQVSGRNDLTWAERKRLDLEYVERRSLALDLRIFAATVPLVLLRRGVYNDAPAAAAASQEPYSDHTNDLHTRAA